MPKSVDKRDRGRAYTPEDLERKYKFGEMLERLLRTEESLKEILENGIAMDIATTSKNGLMSAEMVQKLNGISAGANNMTYAISSGDSNGQIKVTPSSGSPYNVAIKGLGSAAYTSSGSYAPSNHTHDDRYYTESEITSKLSGYLPLSGGELTGKLTVNQNIWIKLSTRTDTPLYVWDGDAAGMGIRIGAGGAVVIGSGESATNLISNLSIGGATEQTYVTSDGNIYFYSNCQTIANKKNVLTLTNGGVAQVNGSLTVNGTAVSLNGHTHDYMASDRIVIGTYVYSGASTSNITITGGNSSGKSFVVACCQDAGAAVKMAKVYNTNVIVQLTEAVTLARINYFLFN